MTSSITAACTQKPSYSPITNGIAIPDNILTEIFFRTASLKNIHSLLLTDRNTNKFILNNNELWVALLEKHFSVSYDPAQSGSIPIEAYKEALAWNEYINSNLCTMCELLLGQDHNSEIVAMDLHNGRLTLLFEEINEDKYGYQSIAIWDLNNNKPIEIPSSIENELSASHYLLYGAVIHKDTLYLAINPKGQIQIQAFDLNNGKQTTLHECTELIDFSKQGNLLYCISLQKDQERYSSPATIKIWDMNTGDQLCNQTIGIEYSRAFPYKDNIILYDRNEKNIIIWNYKTQEKSIIIKNREFSNMKLYKDYLLFYDRTNEGDSITVFDLTNSKTHLIERNEMIGSLLAYAGMFVVFSSTGRRNTITISDIETGEKLREREESSTPDNKLNSFFVVHKSKLLFGHNSSVKIFDFDPLKHYEHKLQKSLETNDYAQLLKPAVMMKKRGKILEYVDKLIAADPTNKEFIEILCENTEGDSSHIYEFTTNTAFDYRKTIQSAPFHLIENAVSEFTSKLKTDHNIQFNLIEFDQTLSIDSVSRESSEPTTESDEPSSSDNDDSVSQ